MQDKQPFVTNILSHYFFATDADSAGGATPAAGEAAGDFDRPAAAVHQQQGHQRKRNIANTDHRRRSAANRQEPAAAVGSAEKQPAV